MTTIEDFRNHCKLVLGLGIDTNPLWESVSKSITIEHYDETSLLTSFISSYPELIKHNLDITEVTDTLFFELLLFAINQRGPTSERMWMTPLKNAFEVWTQYGTRDLTSQHATALGEALNKKLKQPFIGVFMQDQICDTAFVSRKLWDVLESTISQIHAARTDDMKERYNYLFHKHAPHLATFDNRQELELSYFNMCGLFAKHKPPLLGMIDQLKDKHHNLLAYTAALKHCDAQDPTSIGSWMQMSDTFSSLDLDLSDQDAWRFWHLLRECTKDNESGQELIDALAQTQCAMHQAFENLWPIVDALEEGHERYVRAADQSKHLEHINTLNLPADSQSFLPEI